MRPPRSRRSVLARALGQHARLKPLPEDGEPVGTSGSFAYLERGAVQECSDGKEADDAVFSAERMSSSVKSLKIIAV